MILPENGEQRDGDEADRIPRLGTFCALLAAVTASAQEDGGHAAHHPENAIASSSAPATPASHAQPSAPATGMSGMSGMSGMMANMMTGEGEGQGHHGGANRDPFFSRLLSYGNLNSDQRSDLAKDAARRVHEGTRLIEEASMRALHAHDPEGRLQAANDLSEGARLLREGAGAQGALSGQSSPQEFAENWYRDQLSIPKAEHAATSGPWGFSNSHLLLMLFLGLVSSALIVLQLLRLQRVRHLVTRRIPPITSGSVKGSGSSLPAQSAIIPNTTDATSRADPESRPSEGAATASPRKSRSWSGQLRVTQIVRETPSIRTFRLANPSSDRLPFDFFARAVLAGRGRAGSGKNLLAVPIPSHPRPHSAPMLKSPSSARNKGRSLASCMTMLKWGTASRSMVRSASSRSPVPMPTASS